MLMVSDPAPAYLTHIGKLVEIDRADRGRRPAPGSGRADVGLRDGVVYAHPWRADKTRVTGHSQRPKSALSRDGTA